jgi:hypothetical protein
MKLWKLISESKTNRAGSRIDSHEVILIQSDGVSRHETPESHVLRDNKSLRCSLPCFMASEIKSEIILTRKLPPYA